MIDFFVGFLIAYITVWVREKFFPHSIPALYMINKAQRKRQHQIAEKAIGYIRMGFDPASAGGIARKELERVAMTDMQELMNEGLTNGSLEDRHEGWNLIPR
jgi:hypothetical protein